MGGVSAAGATKESRFGFDANLVVYLALVDDERIHLTAQIATLDRRHDCNEYVFSARSSRH